MKKEKRRRVRRSQREQGHSKALPGGSCTSAKSILGGAGGGKGGNM